MKNLNQGTRTPVWPHPTGFYNDRSRTVSPTVEEETEGYSRVLLAKFLHKLNAGDGIDAAQGNLPVKINRENVIRKAAYYHYLDRQKRGLHGSPEEDWHFAEVKINA